MGIDVFIYPLAYVAIGGVFNPPPSRCTFYPVALEPLRIVSKAFVTSPEYVWAKNAEKNLDIYTSICNIAAGKWTPN